MQGDKDREKIKRKSKLNRFTEDDFSEFIPSKKKKKDYSKERKNKFSYLDSEDSE